MPRVSTAHKTQRRAEIIDAARICFARSGFQGATLQDVFAEAGLSAGCVYNYFPSKDALILAIAEERHRDETEILDAAAKIADPCAALAAVAKKFADAYLGEDGDAKRRISLLTWSESLINKDVLASVREGVDAPRERLAALIKRGQKSGGLRRDIDADVTARAMIALLHGFVLQKLWDAKVDKGKALALWRQLIDSLRA